MTKDLPDETPDPAEDKYAYPTDELERAAAGLPPLSSEGKRDIDPPPLVRAGVTAWLTTAAVLAIGFVLMILNMDDIAASQVDAYERGMRAGDKIVTDREITAADVHNSTPGFVWFLAFGGMTIAVLIAVFAYRAREGTRSARSVLVALAVLIAAFDFGLPSAFINFAHWAALIIAVGATVLLFLPAVDDYFARLPNTRRRWQEP